MINENRPLPNTTTTTSHRRRLPTPPPSPLRSASAHKPAHSYCHVVPRLRPTFGPPSAPPSSCPHLDSERARQATQHTRRFRAPWRQSFVGLSSRNHRSCKARWSGNGIRRRLRRSISGGASGQDQRR